MPRKQNQQQNKMSGGDGTADWGKAVFGDANQQHAVSDTDNTIAVNPPASCGASAAMKGGARKELQQLLNQKMQEMQQNSQEGGSLMQQLSDLSNLLNKNKLSNKDMNQAMSMTGGSGVLENIAVPAILLYLNQRIGKKQSVSAKKQKSMKLRKSSRLSRKFRK